MEFAGLATRVPTVSSGSPLDVKEQVRQAIDIVDLVGSFVSLRRQGRQYVGLCPWHDDSRPSLFVNPERQIFRCWVCNLGGDVFSFMMQMEGVSFPEALAMLAERAGIPLKPQARQSAGPSAPGAPAAKRTLLKVMAWAEAQYHTCLLKLPEGEPGRKYLADRRISSESIEKFHLGFCPDQWDWILRRAEPSGPGAKLLEAVGVLVRAAGTGRPYDRFKGRVLFPIRDTQSRPVGLGGRVLPELAATTPAKYVNSPETPLFSKSNLLYGLDQARDAIRKTGQAMVMEGYTDVIMAHQFGFQNAVAVLGTALGESHIRVLKRFADRSILVLDGDEAGQKRANEVLDLFVAQQVDLRILTLPEGADPCEFLLEHGAEGFSGLLTGRAVDALEHAFQVATRGIDLARDVHGTTQALERLLGILAKAPRQRDDTTQELRLREQKILQRLAASFRLDERDVRGRLTELRRRTRQSATPRRSPGPQPGETAAVPGADPCERALLELLIQHPQLVAESRRAIEPARFESPQARQIYEACCRLAEQGGSPDFDHLMLELDDMQVKSLLVELDEQGQAKAGCTPDPLPFIKELITAFDRRDAQRERPAQAVALRQPQLEPNEQLGLLEQIIQQERARQGISRPTDG